MPLRNAPALLLMSSLFGCGGGDETDVATWTVVARSDEAALLSVSGTSSRDVWLAGADAGDGPLVLHWDGDTWQREASGVSGELWWVHALPSGSVFFGGAGGHVLRYRAGEFERLATPALGVELVFGVWGPSDDDVYAVGSVAGSDGFVWHFDGQVWAALPLPVGLPEDEQQHVPGFFKVWGTSAEDVWVVGDRGLVLRGNAVSGFQLVPTGSEERLFTVHAAAGELAMVGGTNNGLAFEANATALEEITPPGSGLLQGVCVSDAGAIWAVGIGGAVYRRPAHEAAWQEQDTHVPVQSLHAVWLDPQGGVWTVGGNVLTTDLDAGVALHYGSSRLAGAVDFIRVPASPSSLP